MRRGMPRGQVTVEYIVILSLVSIVFLVTISTVMAGSKAQAQAVWARNAAGIARQVAWEIDKAHIGGDGYKHNITIPQRLIGGVDYNITVRPRLVTVIAIPYGSEFEWKVITADIEGVATGMSIEKGILTFCNYQGSVNITVN